ncbi:MAG: anhydro-N-acetylmuramic acid kinase [Lysobacterales bacterium]
MTAQPELYLGLISGTSMDGIDVALVDWSNQQPRLIDADAWPYDDDLRQRVAETCQGTALSAGDLATLDSRIAIAFATAAISLLQRHNVKASDVRALGSHGQNVFHGPTLSPSSTLQLGNPHLIANITGITTVADFRRRDVAMGGQGAPLAPALHEPIFRSKHESRAVLNLGGIGNLTLLPKSGGQPVRGFDSGPGNCLMDEWICEAQNLAFDVGGQWAESGTVQTALLDKLKADPYFRKDPPKSTGREYFHLNWVRKSTPLDAFAQQDLQATFSQLTADTACEAMLHQLPDCTRLLVCGGGARNTDLMDRIRKRLGEGVTVVTTDHHGISADWVEAVLFAQLAKAAVHQRTTNLESVTGARAHVYGLVFPA